MKHPPSIKKLRREETNLDRIANLETVILNLKAAEEGCQAEGIHLFGNLADMVKVCQLVIREIEDEYIY